MHMYLGYIEETNANARLTLDDSIPSGVAGQILVQPKHFSEALATPYHLA